MQVSAANTQTPTDSTETGAQTHTKGSTSESRVQMYLVCLHLVVIRECVHGVGHMVGAAGRGCLTRG